MSNQCDRENKKICEKWDLYLDLLKSKMSESIQCGRGDP